MKEKDFEPYNGIEYQFVSSLEANMQVGYTLGSSANYSVFADAVISYQLDPAGFDGIQHVILITEENHGFTWVAGASGTANSSLPFIKDLINNAASDGTIGITSKNIYTDTFTSYDAAAHPSLPNYLAFTSALNETNALKSKDCYPFGSTATEPAGCPSAGFKDTNTNLFTYMASIGLSWSEFSEGPSTLANCYRENSGTGDTTYIVHHDAAPYYSKLVNSTPMSCLKRDMYLGTVSSSGIRSGNLLTAITSNKLANFTEIQPDYCNTGDTCSSGDPEVVGTDTWLSEFIPSLASYPIWAHTLVIVTWDEAYCTGSNYKGCNDYPTDHVLTLVMGPHSLISATSGSENKITTSFRYGHYSIVATVQEIFNDGKSSPYINYARNSTVSSLCFNTKKATGLTKSNWTC